MNNKLDTLSGGTVGNFTDIIAGGEVADSGKAKPGGVVVGTSDAQTLTNKTLIAPYIADFTNAQHDHEDAAGAGQLREEALNLRDVTINNSSITKHGFFPKLPNDAMQFINGVGTWVSKTIYVPASITVNTGTPAGGVNVSQTQVPFDGNVYQVGEVVGVPGFNIEIAFTSVIKFDMIVLRADYDGSNSHFCGIDIYNYNSLSWQQAAVLRHTSTLYDWYTLANVNNVNYVDGSGNAKIRLYHYSNGNNAHNVYIDYAALISNIGW
jgi:hypothetical protein